MDGVDWLYSGLEGNLAFVVDFQIKTKYLILFDPTNYENVFQYALYNGFEKFFEELALEFRHLKLIQDLLAFNLIKHMMLKFSVEL